MIPVPHPSALEAMAIHEPGLTAGSTYYRLFEAGMEMIGHIVLRSAGHTFQARSAASE